MVGSRSVLEDGRACEGGWDCHTTHAHPSPHTSTLPNPFAEELSECRYCWLCQGWTWPSECGAKLVAVATRAHNLQPITLVSSYSHHLHHTLLAIPSRNPNPHPCTHTSLPLHPHILTLAPSHPHPRPHPYPHSHPCTLSLSSSPSFSP